MACRAWKAELIELDSPLLKDVELFERCGFKRSELLVIFDDETESYHVCPREPKATEPSPRSGADR